MRSVSFSLRMGLSATSLLVLLGSGVPARADDAPATPQSLSDEIYTLKEQAAGLQAMNQKILASLDELKKTLASKLPSNAAPVVVNTPTAPTGPPDLKAAAAKLQAPDALNLDGGPSTQLVVKLPGLALSLPGGWGVPNALVVAPRKQ